MAMTEAEKFISFLDGNPGWQAGNVLDVRPLEAYEAGHLPGATSIPLEQGSSTEGAGVDLDIRLPSILLPPRHEPLLVVAGSLEFADGLAEHLTARERASVAGMAWPGNAWQDLPGDWLEVGRTRNCLWRPPKWLADHLDLLPPPAAGPVLDLACGSGRAMVWLAEKGYRVTGIDWQPEALDLGRRLAADRGVEGRFLVGDLRDIGTVPPGPWAIILNFRFRQIGILEKMRGWLKPGGVAVARTFRAAPGYEGHPSPRYRLGPGELLGYFPAASCDVLAHEESHDPDGRPAAGIVARKI